jgi:hypothetical protein
MNRTPKELLAARLKAVMQAFHIRTLADCAKITGAKENNVSMWKNARTPKNGPDKGNGIPWWAASRICDATGVTLDWWYRGKPAGMDPSTLLRLNALTQTYLEEAKKLDN